MFRSTPLLRTLLTSSAPRALRTAAVSLPRFSALPIAHRSISSSLRLGKDASETAAKAPAAVEQEQEQEEEEEEEEEDVMNEYDAAWENEMLGGAFPPAPVRAQGKVHVQLVSYHLDLSFLTSNQADSPLFHVYKAAPSFSVRPQQSLAASLPFPSRSTLELTPPSSFLSWPLSLPTGNRSR